jgi:hypothetical protein
MAREGLIEESLKVVYRWLHLVLDTTPGGHDVLLVRVIRFLVINVIGRDYNPLRASLAPLLAALGALLDALDGDVGWRRSDVVEDCFPALWDKDRPGCLPLVVY